MSLMSYSREHGLCLEIQINGRDLSWDFFFSEKGKNLCSLSYVEFGCIWMKDLKDYPKVPNAECILETKLHFIIIIRL